MKAAANLATRLEDGQTWLSDELKKETLMDDTSAVSYTHLDVYKRQHPHWA